jgi:hypothetical protein
MYGICGPSSLIVLDDAGCSVASADGEGLVSMSTCKTVALHAGLLLLAVLHASAASRNSTIRIKVLDSETRAVSLDNNGVARNCEQVTFDAYCRSTTTAPLVNTLVVQEGDQPPFRISCKAETRFSRCVPLPKGASLDARKEKKGVTVYYEDSNGKMRSQLYTLVAVNVVVNKDAGFSSSLATGTAGNAAEESVPATSPAKAAAANGAAPASATSANDVAATGQPEGAAATPAGAGAIPSTAGATPAAASSTLNSGQAAVTGSMEARSRETVKCSFSSTPSGAEVTVDGRFVGSTPSVVGVTTGTHVVVITMAGFQEWKRELSVAAGSELTVNAVLQKVQ